MHNHILRAIIIELEEAGILISNGGHDIDDQWCDRWFDIIYHNNSLLVFTDNVDDKDYFAEFDLSHSDSIKNLHNYLLRRQEIWIKKQSLPSNLTY